jgi:hypothetical protein
MTSSYQTTGEDARASAILRTTLSAYVITAALAGVAAQATITTFVIDKRDHLDAFYAVAGVGFVGLLASAVVGALGISEIYDEGATGVWSRDTGHGKLNAQGLLVLLGIVFVVASVFIGKTKTSSPAPSPALARVTVAVESLRQRDAVMSARLRALHQEVNRLRLQLRRRH